MPGLDVDQISEVIDRLQSHPVALHSTLCARQRHRLSICTRCVDTCPSGAIFWQDGLQVNWEACIGCGICASVCPTGAIEARSPSDDEMLVQIQRAVDSQGWVAFACPRAQEISADRGPCVSVRCLGRLDEGLLVSAAARGAQSVWLVDGACEGCPQAVGRVAAGVMLGRSNALLEAFGMPVRAVFRPDLPSVPEARSGGNGAAQGVSRRGLFKALARETARVGEITSEVAEKGERPELGVRVRGELPRALPGSRLLLLAALKQLGSPSAATLTGDESGIFVQFQLGEGCTGCQMCAFFCPTGALTRVMDGSRIGLAFRASHCTNCGLCRDICYRDAVLLSPEVDLSKVTTMAVDWCFAQEMDAEPWKKGPGDQIARQILGVLNK